MHIQVSWEIILLLQAKQSEETQPKAFLTWCRIIHLFGGQLHSKEEHQDNPQCYRRHDGKSMEELW